MKWFNALNINRSLPRSPSPDNVRRGPVSSGYQWAGHNGQTWNKSATSFATDLNWRHRHLAQGWTHSDWRDSSGGPLSYTQELIGSFPPCWSPEWWEFCTNWELRRGRISVKYVHTITVTQIIIYLKETERTLLKIYIYMLAHDTGDGLNIDHGLW